MELVALRLGLRVERTELGDGVSGVLVVQDGRGVIGVNESDSPVRQRFTIAHECGHFELHRGQMPVFIDKQFLKPMLAAFRDGKSSSGEDLLERQANAFAATLLMPEHLVLDEVSRLRLDVEDDAAVDELSCRFEVSKQAMSFRLANLFAWKSR